MPGRIVTTHYRYKRPARKQQAQPLAGPAVVRRATTEDAGPRLTGWAAMFGLKLRHGGLLLALVGLACSSRGDPGISREKAEAVLRGYDFTDISLQPSSEGWTGTTVPRGGGYRMKVTVDRRGVMQLQPDL